MFICFIFDELYLWGLHHELVPWCHQFVWLNEALLQQHVATSKYCQTSNHSLLLTSVIFWKDDLTGFNKSIFLVMFWVLIYIKGSRLKTSIPVFDVHSTKNKKTVTADLESMLCVTLLHSEYIAQWNCQWRVCHRYCPPYNRIYIYKLFQPKNCFLSAFAYQIIGRI